MTSSRTTRDLSDKHEEHIAATCGGRICRGSGNQAKEPLDVRMSPGRHTPFAFGFDGKSTRGKSHSITRAAWEKLLEQAHGLLPAMPLRFYRDDDTLTPDHDLVVLRLDDFAQLLELASTYQEMRDR